MTRYFTCSFNLMSFSFFILFGLSGRYAEFGINSFCLRTGLKLRSGWEGQVWRQVGDSMHNTTRYGELETDAVRRNSLGVVFRNWHPGPLGFQVVGDAFGWWYLHSLLRALDLLEAALESGKSLRSEWPAKPTRLQMSDLPPPSHCDPTICSSEFPPGCTYFAEPAHGQPQIGCAFLLATLAISSIFLFCFCPGLFPPTSTAIQLKNGITPQPTWAGVCGELVPAL